MTPKSFLLEISFLALVLLPACMGNGGNGSTCDPADFFVAGAWTSSFRCRDGNPSFGCFTGGDTLTVKQDGSPAQPGNTVSFTDGEGGQFSGQICGKTFTWSGTGTGITESGTWVFSDAEHFSKTTHYDRTDGSGGGDCSGDGAKDPLTAPAAPSCP